MEKRPEQTSTVSIKHLAALGVLLTITDEQGRTFDLANTHDFNRTVRPGQSITITAKGDERWEAAQSEREAREQAASQQASAAVDANSDGQGEAAQAADISDLPGATTVDNGATTSTSRPSRTR
jgi:hypothetical protein